MGQGQPLGGHAGSGRAALHLYMLKPPCAHPPPPPTPSPLLSTQPHLLCLTRVALIHLTALQDGAVLTGSVGLAARCVTPCASCAPCARVRREDIPTDVPALVASPSPEAWPNTQPRLPICLPAHHPSLTRMLVTTPPRPPCLRHRLSPVRGGTYVTLDVVMYPNLTHQHLLLGYHPWASVMPPPLTTPHR